MTITRTRAIFLTAGILGAIATLLSAFGAHFIAAKLTPNHLKSFETAVNFHMIHAIVLLFIGLFQSHFPEVSTRWVFRSYFWGIVLFSGSIYVITIMRLMEWGIPKWIHIITPLGGVSLLAGWIFLIKALTSARK